MNNGETIASGAKPKCDDCGDTPELDVYSTPAGYYIGTYCKCGPFSRESEYFKTRKVAEETLERWKAGEKARARTTKFDEEGAKQMQAIELDGADPEEIISLLHPDE